MKGQLWIIALGIIALFILGTVAIYFGLYNTLVGLDVTATNKWADVQAQYQRRADLIPAVVNATKGYMLFEKTVLEDVTNARSRWQVATTQDEQIAAGNTLDSAISRLLFVYENYPQLKSDAVVRDLMVQLEGTENRIAVARMDYNNAVRKFNTAIRAFPSNIVAGMTGFTEKKEFFQAANASQTAPSVNISIV